MFSPLFIRTLAALFVWFVTPAAAANRLFNFDIARRQDAATVTWESRFPGINDTLRYRTVGSPDWQIGVNPELENTSQTLIDAALLLLDADVDVREGQTEPLEQALAAGGINAPYEEEFVANLVAFDRRLRTRRHRVTATLLLADTQYEYEATSGSLQGERSAVESGLFRTRTVADLRHAFGADLDIQTTASTAVASWLTNRECDTRLLINEVGEAPLDELRLDEDQGSFVHIVSPTGLKLDTEYEFIVTSRLVGVDELIEQATLTEEEASFIKTGTFRTRSGRQPLRLLAPPATVAAADRATVNVRFNQIALVDIDYGPQVGSGGSDGSVFTSSLGSGDVLGTHSITLSDLEPSTTYGFRISAQTPEGDILTTDPQGTDQWSRNLSFKTAAAGDALPPVIIEGPGVTARDIFAVVSFTTDVDTRATVFFGTMAGTYGTADEFEIRDHTPDGNLRLSREHAIIIGGLEAGAAYEYGILVEGTNGVTTSFERDLFAGKVAGVHQPPGGGGQFTTSSDPDTQLPVILSGPTVTSETHDTAIVEYTTDEPASSEVRFGTTSPDDFLSSGESRTRHKLTLTNLEAGTSYLYLVASTDASGNGATQSSMAVFTTDPEIDVTAPGFDVEPNISYKNDETATVSWTMDEESTGEVRFGTTAEDLGFIRSLPETGTQHEITLTNLEVATEYFVQASSSDLSNNGPSESTVFSFTTDAVADLSAPIISDLQFEPNNESAVITWTTDEFADSFIDFGTTSGLLDLAVGSVDDVTEHEVVLTNLTANTTYFFTAGSIDRANNPATATAEQSFTTLGSADATPPAVPANLLGSSGNGLAILTWDANSELDFDSYTLARRLEGVGDFVDIASGLTGLTYTDQGLTNDVAYEYQIKAVDKTGNPSDGSTALAVTPTGTMAPTLPIDLARGGESLTPTFSFTNATPFVSQATLTYTIQVSTQQDFSNVVDSESGILSGDTETSWTITRDLTADVTYYWRVRAIEGELIGQWTNTQQFLALDVTLVGDFNGDLTVNLDDFFLFADKFGQAATGEAAKFDLEPDGTIDLDDFFLFADKFGTSAAAKQWAFAQYLDEEAHVWIDASADNAGHRLGQGLITVRVKAEQVNDISAFGMVLNYDHTAVTFEAAEEGPGHLLEMNGANAPFFTVFRHRPGQLVIGNALVDDEPVSGQGLLAQLTFRTRQGPTNDAFFELADAVVAHNGITRRIARTSAGRVKPDTYKLSANFPNPFNPTTTIDYALPEAAHVQLVIYDLLGQAIRTMANSHHEAGFYSAVWNATDDDDRPVANGLYFYKLSAGHFNSIGKMMLLK